MISRSILREQLGKKLGGIRQKNNISGRSLAKLLKISQSTLSKLENGQLNPSDDFLQKFISFFSLTTEEENDLIQLAEIVSDRLHRITIGSGAEFTRIQKLITTIDYSTLRIFQMSVVPGLLQIEQYIKGIFLTDIPSSYTEDDINNDIYPAIQERISQTRKITETDKQFCFLIHENALRTKICSVSDMLIQLDYLKLISRKSNIEIGLIPLDTDYSEVDVECPQCNFDLYDESLLMIQIHEGFLTIWDEYLRQRYSNYFQRLKEISCFDNLFEKKLDIIMNSLKEKQSLNSS